MGSSVSAAMIKELGGIFGFDPDPTNIVSERGRILGEGFSCRCDGGKGCPNREVCMAGYMAMSNCFKVGDIDPESRALLKAWHEASCDCKGIPKLQGSALVIVKAGSEIHAAA